MIFALTMMAIAISISAIAAWYSIAGLTAIFAAAVVPVIIMGGALEAGKIIATVWLHNNWKRITWVYKTYLIPAIVFLMIITSMGIFGFLSKAHSDQSLVSGDSMSKVAVFDEQIKTERDNIDANKKALTQMDAQVDQMLGRSDNERGAERAVTIRKQQAKERTSLQSEIIKSQKTITKLQEERAPLAAEFRKIEAEVGPIKYIAAFIYGDNPDQNVLEKSVRWVIILIVIVFDPLALCLILAANKHLEWAHEDKIKRKEEELAAETVLDKMLLDEPGPIERTVFEPKEREPNPEPDVSNQDIGQCPKCDTDLLDAPGIGPFCPNKECDVMDGMLLVDPLSDTIELAVEQISVTTDEEDEAFNELDAKLNPEPVITELIIKAPEPKEEINAVVEDEYYPFPMERPIEGVVQEDQKGWSNSDVEEFFKILNEKVAAEKLEDELAEIAEAELIEEPVDENVLDDAEGVTVEAFRKLPGDYVEYEGKHMHQRVLKDSHPELFALREDSEDGTTTGFGIEFPKFAVTGDIFVRVDSLPNRVFKFNRNKWVEIAREQSDTYLHNDKYMKYLIDKIGAGEIDPEILTGTEQDLLEQFIRNPK